MPAAGAGSMIKHEGTSTASRSSSLAESKVLDPNDLAVLSALKASGPAPIKLTGFASADEPATLATERANAVKAVLTAPPHAVVVSSSVGNAAATATRSDFAGARSVIQVGAAPATTLDCSARNAAGRLIHPPTQPCPVMDPPTWAAFGPAWTEAKNAVTRANGVLNAAARTGAEDALIDRFSAITRQRRSAR